jgi:hypothetical protein
MIALEMIVRDELGDRFPQSAFSEDDQPVQARLLDGAHETLGMRIQVR